MSLNFSRPRAALLLAAAGLAAAAISCGGMGRDAPDQRIVPQSPPLDSFLPVFIQLVHQGKTSELAAVVKELSATGQVVQLVDALDLSLRAVGNAAMKNVLMQVLSDGTMRSFFSAGGPFGALISYPDIEKMAATLHVMGAAGLVENGVVPLISAVADSPLLRTFKDAGREMLTGGIPSVLGLAEGFAVEKVEFPYYLSGSAPALTPLLRVFLRDIQHGELQTFLYDLIDLAVMPELTPLLPVVGGVASTIAGDGKMGRDISEGLGRVVSLLDSPSMDGLRKTVDHLLVNSVPIYPKDLAPVMVSIPDKVYKLWGPDGKGGKRIISLLRDLGPETVEGAANALSQFVSHHCVNPVEGPDPLAHPSEPVNLASGKYSCFMQMIHMVYSMYQKKMAFDDASRKSGADLLTWKCSPLLEPDDPEWNTAIQTLGHGKQPLLPNFPNNVTLDYHEQMAIRTVKQAVGYTSYINCILHGKMGDLWIYKLQQLDWNVDIIGFAALEVMGRNGALDIFVPLLNAMRIHPDGTNHVRDLAELLAGLWGNNGAELNPLSYILDSATNYPSTDRSLVFYVTKILDSLLSQKVWFNGAERASADLLVDIVLKLNVPDTDGKPLVSKMIAAPLLSLISKDIDEYLFLAAPGAARVLANPAYNAEGLFAMLEDALAERPGHVSFTEYLDPSSPHFQPEFRAKARELVDAFVPTFGVIALYLYEKDTDGSLADVLAYAIGQGVVGDTLELLNRLMDYDRDNIVLDFMSKMNGTGAILTLMDMIDAIQQAGMLPATVPVLKLLSDRNVFPEFMDLLYVFLPRIRLGE